MYAPSPITTSLDITTGRSKHKQRFPPLPPKHYHNSFHITQQLKARDADLIDITDNPKLARGLVTDPSSSPATAP